MFISKGYGVSVGMNGGVCRVVVAFVLIKI